MNTWYLYIRTHMYLLHKLYNLLRYIASELINIELKKVGIKDKNYVMQRIILLKSIPQSKS